MKYVLRWDERPFTTNGERRLVPMQRAHLVKKWREAFRYLAVEANIPHYLRDVSIIVTPYYKDNRAVSDCGGVAPAAKAAIDGLVDANVMEDDNPKFLKFLGFRAPVIGHGDGLELEIVGDLSEPPKRRRQPSQKPKPRKVRSQFGRAVPGSDSRTSRRP